jgi:hypothetical protein
MTKINNNNEDNADTKQPAPSPNDRKKKKTKQDNNEEEADPMDLESTKRQLFDDTEQQQNSNDSTDNDTPGHITKKQTITPDGTEDDKTTMDDENESESKTNEDVSPMDDSQLAEDEDEIEFQTSPFLLYLHQAESDIWTRKINNPTELWKSNPDWASEYTHLVTDEIHGTGDCDPDDSLTAQLELGIEFLETEASGNGVTTVAEWMQIFDYAFAEEADDMEDCIKLRRVALRLALTDPISLFPSSSWKKGRLLMNHDSHSAWIASYHIFGAPWKNRRQWFSSERPKKSPTKRTATGQMKADTPEKTKETNDTTSPKAVGFAQDAENKLPQETTNTSKKNLPSKNPLYLNKPLIVNPYKTKKVRKMKDHGRKHKTYIKVKMVKVTSDNQSEQQEEVSTCFNNIMVKLWNIDPTAILLSWKDDLSTIKPLKQSSDFPKSKEQMLKFVDRMWIEKSKPAYCRMIVNHDKDADSLFNDSQLQNWMEDNDLSLQIERIQSTKTACAGHLLGYQPFACNVDNLADSIEQNQLMKGIKVEVRQEFVVLADPKNKSAKNKERTKTKILKIYVPWNQTGEARKALVKIYSSKSNKSYPQGVMARFVPDITDTRFVRTSAQVLAYRNSLLKHIKFMNATMTHASYNIIELDHYLPKMRMTLRQAIMHIFSSSKPKWNLFLSVDTSYYGDSVNFSFRSELQEEAINMISALPLFLEAMTGKQAVWNWFTKDARAEAALYAWDKDKGIVPLSDLEDALVQLVDWEELDDVDDIEEQEEVILQPFRLDLDNLGTNTYGDAGTIVTEAIMDKTTEPDDEEDEVDEDDDEGTPPSSITTHKKSNSKKKPNPNTEASITNTSATAPTDYTPSTLTQTPEVAAILEYLTTDPEMINKFAAMIMLNKSKEGPSTNEAGADNE